ncbi:os03g0343300 related [Cystoisospora suis]|uniref:Os03g0343300 related n=1 Tax=Cystoisospora suis TaxID=483139 RepID=A0A2C6KH60_9APIC|nr:os03g0343300 related [Cystoisospora suis]
MVKGKKAKSANRKKTEAEKQEHGEEEISLGDKSVSSASSGESSQPSQRKRKIVAQKRQHDRKEEEEAKSPKEKGMEEVLGERGEVGTKKKKKMVRKESIEEEEEAKDESDDAQGEGGEEENDSSEDEEEEENPWLIADGMEPDEGSEEEEDEEEGERGFSFSKKGTNDVIDVLSRREDRSDDTPAGERKRGKGKGREKKKKKDAEGICDLMNQLTSGAWKETSKTPSDGEDEDEESNDEEEEEEGGSDEDCSSSPSRLFKAFQGLRQEEDNEEDQGERGVFDGVMENDLSLLKLPHANKGLRRKGARQDDGHLDATADSFDAKNDLSFSSLLHSLNSTDSLHLTSLRKQLESLSAPQKVVSLSTSAESAEGSSSSSSLPSSSSTSVLIPACSDDIVREPLPRSKEELATRVVQYEQATKDIRKWTGLVQRNAQSIQLQLGGPPEDVELKVKSINQVVAEFKPNDDFEQALLAAVRADGVEDEELKKSGVLAPADPIKKQLEQRQVARLKFLLFNEQRRARRIKKIKSKVGRKKRKQVEQREEEKIMERLEVENPTLAEELRRKFEEKRAKIRLLRQQNARSKWASVAARFGGRDMQREISRQKQREVDEKRTVERIAKGRGLSDSEDHGSSSSDSDGDEGGEDFEKLSPGEKARLLQQLAKETSETNEPLPEKGLLSLPFMRRAIEKKRERNREEIAKLQRLSNHEGGGEADSDDDDSEDEDDGDSRRKGRSRRNAEDSDLESQPDEMDDERANGRETRDGGEEKRDRLSLLQQKRGAPTDRKNIKSNLDPDAVKKAENELEGLWHHFELKEEDEDEEKERKELENIEKENYMEKQMKKEKEGEGEREGRKGFFESVASAKSFFKEALKVEEQAREEREKKRRREKIEEDAKRERKLREERNKKNSIHMKDQTTRIVEEENPWLVASSGRNKKRRKTTGGEEEAPLGDGDQTSSGQLAFSSNPSSLLTPEEQLEEYLRGEDGDGEFSDDQCLNHSESSQAAGPSVNGQSASGSHNGGEENKKNKKSTSQWKDEQKDLIHQAFVCDSDVEEEFYQDHLKEQEAEGEGGKNGGGHSSTGALPGWGSWHGPGIRAWKKNSQHRGDQQKTSSTSAGETGEKKKVKRPCVILNQKLDRKAAKYLVSELPHPYKSAEQYEATLQHATGPEWNTASMHARLIAPKINVRVGAVIPPLQYARRHLGAAERDAILEAWDSKASRRQRTKTRF